MHGVHGAHGDEREQKTRRAVSLARDARDTCAPAPAVADRCAELAARIGDAPAAGHLFEELTCAPDGFVTSAAARTLFDKFRRVAGSSAHEADLAGVTDPAARRSLADAWLSSYAAASTTRAPDRASNSRAPTAT